MGIAQIAFKQHGVITLEQLRSTGLGAGAIDLRVQNGRLHRLHRGVFAVGHVRISQEGWWLAAALALGDGAVLSHVSAAALWGIRPSSSHTRTLRFPPRPAVGDGEPSSCIARSRSALRTSTSRRRSRSHL